MAQLSDPVEIGLRLTLKVYELAKALETKSQEGSGQGRSEEKIGKSLQTRASEISSLILSAGLVPALTMYMSKSDPGVYKEVYLWLKGGHEIDSKIHSRLKEEFSKEGRGYSIILALVSYALTELFGSEFDRSKMDDIGELARALLSVREKGRELTVQNGLLPLLLEVKKLSKALFD